MFTKVLRKKLKNEKGFTLAELLIVVAILAILVAVSVPIFTGKLNDAKKATDESNIRAAKALIATEILENDLTSGSYYYDAEKGVVVATSGSGSITGYGKSTKAVKGADGEPKSGDQEKILEITITNGQPTLKWVAPPAS